MHALQELQPVTTLGPNDENCINLVRPENLSIETTHVTTSSNGGCLATCLGGTSTNGSSNFKRTSPTTSDHFAETGVTDFEFADGVILTDSENNGNHNNLNKQKNSADVAASTSASPRANEHRTNNEIMDESSEKSIKAKK